MITGRVGQLVTRGDVICDHDEEAANTQVVITKTGEAGFRFCLHGVQWSYSETPAAGARLLIQSASTVLLEVDIIAGGPGGFNIYLETADGENLVATLTGGGGTAVGNLSIQTVKMPS